MEQKPVPTKSGAERRRYYRLRYPEMRGMPEQAPELRILNDPYLYHAIEISERGLRFKPWNLRLFPIGQRLEARLTFSDGATQPAAGRVLRHDKDEVVVELSMGISYERMMREQRLVLCSRS